MIDDSACTLAVMMAETESLCSSSSISSKSLFDSVDEVHDGVSIPRRGREEVRDGVQEPNSRHLVRRVGQVAAVTSVLGAREEQIGRGFELSHRLRLGSEEDVIPGLEEHDRALSHLVPSAVQRASLVVLSTVFEAEHRTDDVGVDRCETVGLVV